MTFVNISIVRLLADQCYQLYITIIGGSVYTMPITTGLNLFYDRWPAVSNYSFCDCWTILFDNCLFVDRSFLMPVFTIAGRLCLTITFHRRPIFQRIGLNDAVYLWLLNDRSEGWPMVYNDTLLMIISLRAEPHVCCLIGFPRSHFTIVGRSGLTILIYDG